MTGSPYSVQVEVAEYVRDLAHELAAMARSAGHERLSFLLEMAELEAADVEDLNSLAASSPGDMNGSETSA
jgi:hypothetical protein